MTISNASAPDANDVRNIYHHGGNVLIGQTGTIYAPIIIENASGVRNVYLYVWGKKVAADSTNPNHAPPPHRHQIAWATSGSGNAPDTTGYQSDTVSDGVNIDYDAPANEDRTFAFSTATSGTFLPGLAGVPQAVQIWIDGVNYTSAIGDQNGKGATMYDSVNNDWGTNGTTEWNTGRLNLTSIITWTAGEHYIELKETGGTGGTIIYQIGVNTGF